MTESAAGRQPRRGWRFWSFIAVMLALLALFIALGSWQVERLAEKEQLIANVAARFAQPAVELPPVAEWGAFDAEAYDFRPVRITGTYRPGQTVLVFTSLADAKGQFSGPGYWVLTPLDVPGGGAIFVNRGFVPQESGPAFADGGPLPQGTQTIEGIARASEAVGSFTPTPDTARRIEWVRNTDRLAALSGSLPGPVAPIYIDLPATTPGALPQGGETVMQFPNNHLGYAITWFGFAALVPVLLLFWARRPRRAAPGP